MTSRRCDVCGSAVTELQALRDEYKRQGIEELCRDCMKEADDALMHAIKQLKALKQQNYNEWLERKIGQTPPRRRKWFFGLA